MVSGLFNKIFFLNLWLQPSRVLLANPHLPLRQLLYSTRYSRLSPASVQYSTGMLCKWAQTGILFTTSLDNWRPLNHFLRTRCRPAKSQGPMSRTAFSPPSVENRKKKKPCSCPRTSTNPSLAHSLRVMVFTAE